jgi:hypothetical protein
MARLLATASPAFEKLPKESWDEHFSRANVELNKLMAVSDALPEGATVGAVLQYAVADGHAFYLVTKETPLTLQHIPFGDGYSIPAPMVRGLRKQDVLEALSARRRFRKLAPKR